MLITLLLSAALAGFPAAPRADHRISNWSLDGSDLCFASGLRVVAVRRPGSGLVRMSTVIEGGLSAEGLDQTGAAWAVAGLRPWSRPGGEGASLAARGLSPQTQVQVTHDALVVSTVAPADELAELIETETAWLADPLAGIDAATLDLARPHLQAAGWAMADDGMLAGSHQLRKQLYPAGHPGRAHALPGSTATVSLDAVAAYAKATHTPARMTLRLEGDLDASGNALGSLVGNLLPDHLLRGAASCDRSAKPETLDVEPGELVAVRAPVPLPQIHMGWHVPVTTSPDEQWLARFADVLAVSMVSNTAFMLTERDRVGWLRGRCQIEQGPRSALLHCSFDLPSADFGERAAKELLRSIPNPVQSEEIAIDFANIGLHGEAALPDAMTAWDGMQAHHGIWRATQTHFGGRWEEAPYLEAVAKVDAREMTKRAMALIGPKNVAIALLLPAERSGDAPSTPAADRISMDSPASKATPRPDLSGVHTHETAFGLPVWIDQRPATQPTLAAARLVLPGGSVSEAAPGVAEAWSTVLTWRNATQSNLLILRSGVSVDRSDLGWAWQVAARGTSANLVPIAWSVRHEIDVPFANYEEQFLRSDIELAVREMLGDRANAINDRSKFVGPPYPDLVSDDTRHAALLAGHPAGLTWWARMQAARTVTGGAIREHAKRLHQPGNGVLVVTSSEPSDQARSVVNKYMGKWKGLPAAEGDAPVAAAGPVGPREIVLYPTTGPVADAVLSCRLPGRTRASRASLEVAAGAVLAQLSLEPSVRAAEVEILPIDSGVSLLQVYTAAHPDYAGHATQSVFSALKNASGGLDPVTLAHARHQASLAHAQRLAGADARASTLASFAVEGFLPEDVAAHPDALTAITADQVRGVLSDCAGHEAVSVTGPVSASSFQGLAEEVRVSDWRQELREIAIGFE